MRAPVRLLLVIVASTLTLAGCSYTPARVETRPLIEVDGYSGHRHYRGDDHRYHRAPHRHTERHYYYDDRRRGGFCPPGQAKKGRC